MNLIIDIGNTYTKLAVFEQNKLVEKESVETDNIIKEVKKIHEKHDAAYVAKMSQTCRQDTSILPI